MSQPIFHALRKVTPTAMATAAVLLLASASFAAPGQRPTDKIAADLNIPESVFISCFSGVSPDKDHAPSGATQRSNKGVLLPCLQDANPSITNARLDAVMDNYRPEGPMKR